MNCEYSRTYGCMKNYVAVLMLGIINEEIVLRQRMNASGLSPGEILALQAEWNGFIERREQVERLYASYGTPCKNCDILLE